MSDSVEIGSCSPAKVVVVAAVGAVVVGAVRVVGLDDAVAEAPVAGGVVVGFDDEAEEPPQDVEMPATKTSVTIRNGRKRDRGATPTILA